MRRSLGERRDMDRRHAWLTLLATLAGVLGPIVFAAGVMVGQALWHGYNPVHQYISLLARGPFGWLQDTTFLVSGTLIAAFGVGFRAHLPGGSRGMHGAHAIVVGGLALALLGIFITNGPGGHASMAGFIHARLFELCEAASFAAIVLCYLHFRADLVWRSLAPYTLATAIALLLVLSSDWVHATHGWQGIQQRSVALVVAVWFEVLAVQLWRLQRAAARLA